jgi:hypothetical protein
MAFLRPTTPNHCPNSHDEINALFRRRLFNIDHPEAIPHRQGAIGHSQDRAPNCDISDFANQLSLFTFYPDSSGYRYGYAVFRFDAFSAARVPAKHASQVQRRKGAEIGAEKTQTGWAGRRRIHALARVAHRGEWKARSALRAGQITLAPGKGAPVAGVTFRSRSACIGRKAVWAKN